MTLTQMQYFQAVCKFENYTKAAEYLHVTQPAISKAIRDVENECSAQLFDHKGNTLLLTESGRKLLKEVEVVLIHVENLKNMISSDSLNRQFVRVGISTFSSSIVFPSICAKYRQLYPEYKIISHEDSTPELFSMLNDGTLDMMLTSPGSYKRKKDLIKDYKILELAETSGLMYCVSKDHRFSNRGKVSLEEIAAEPLIMLDDRYSSTQNFKKLFREHGLELNILLQTSQMFTIERFVECGAAAGFLPQDLTENNEKIVALDYPNDILSRHVALIWKRKGIIFPTMEKFIEVSKTIKEELISNRQ